MRNLPSVRDDLSKICELFVYKQTSPCYNSACSRSITVAAVFLVQFSYYNELYSPGGSLSSGAGLIHRGGRGSGGFLSLKLLTYDLSKHVKAEPPPHEFREETPEFAPVIN